LRAQRARIVGVGLAALFGFALSAADAPAAFRLLSPRPDSVVSRPPLLRWTAASAATHYNVQLWRGNRKVLSRWPAQPRLQLHRSWRYQGRWYSLRPAHYRWYVWPAYRWGYGRFRGRDFIVGRLPANSAPPAVVGEPREGRSLTASTGTWTGTKPLRFSYGWLRCRADGSPCTAIAGATSATLLLGAGDIDSRVRVVVTATNVAGSRSTASKMTAAIVAAPPVAVSVPTLAGAFQLRGLVTATPGRWQSSRPVRYFFRWTRCEPARLVCRTITRASGAGYLLRPADVGQRVRAIVRAVNSGGAAEAASAVSPVLGRVFFGTTAGDVLRGTIGADVIRARAGDDRVLGGPGRDRLHGGLGVDDLAAGTGNDVVFARDGRADRIACGWGRDVAVVDRRDRVGRGCEAVRVRSATVRGRA
jgi:RTX calcium-binding nonapeptide repeat (4 copies)